MSINSKIKSFKDANPELKQRTVRLSKEHYSRVVKYAKKNGIKEGIALRLLLEYSIDEADKPDVQIENNADEALSKEVKSLRDEVDALKRKMEDMWGLVEIYTGGDSKEIDEELDSDKSKGTDEEVDGEHQASTD
ncbi:hypothetical protein [Maridesulfovibrio sp.]|uniref:hypothetical protein n=1 Tax=Maridesulfovibrio sp. TaxID=2795000 RepID=UPI0029CA8072|nr:hypothetical protein [Maridesulfovibrio sp.]